MSFGRTNATVVMVATYIEENPEEDIWVTVVAGGQLITGKVITEDAFFALNDNLGLQMNFNQLIRDERNRIINQISEGNTTEELSEMLAEDFLYLKNSGYVSGGVTYFNDSPDGLSVQIRISDIAAFTYRGLNVQLKTAGEL